MYHMHTNTHIYHTQTHTKRDRQRDTDGDTHTYTYTHREGGNIIKKSHTTHLAPDKDKRESKVLENSG